MYACILGVCIYQYQSIRSHKVNGMIDVQATPWLFWKHPRMHWWFLWLVLVFSTGYALATGGLNVIIYVRPVDSCPCKLFHSLHSKMSLMQLVQNLTTQLGRDDHS